MVYLVIVLADKPYDYFSQNIQKKNLSDKATLLLSAVVRLWIEGLHRRLTRDTVAVFLEQDTVPIRLAPVLKTIFHQCVISYSCSQSYSDGSVLRSLKQSHQSKTGYKNMI